MVVRLDGGIVLQRSWKPNLASCQCGSRLSWLQLTLSPCNNEPHCVKPHGILTPSQYGLWPYRNVRNLFFFSPSCLFTSTHLSSLQLQCMSSDMARMPVSNKSLIFSHFIHSQSIDALLLPCAAREPVSQQVPVEVRKGGTRLSYPTVSANLCRDVKRLAR